MIKLPDMMSRLPWLARTRQLAAVDFDSRKILIVLADCTPKSVRVTGRASADLPAGVDIADPQAVGALLGEALRKLNFRGAGAVMSVPRSQAVLKPVLLPPNTPQQQYASMVNFQVAKELPFPAEDAVIDFTVESHHAAAGDAGGAPGVNVLVAAVRLGVADYYRQVAAAANVKLLRLGLRPYADMRCVEFCQPEAAQGMAALVHVTADETEIDVIRRQALAFSRSAVKSLAPAWDTDAAKQAQSAHTVVLEVARSLQSYHSIERGARIEEVIIAGDTGLEAQAAEQLSSRLGLRCKMLAPGAAFELGGEPIGSEFISALGLAVSEDSSREIPFDFLNPKRAPMVRDVRKTRVQAAALGAMMLLFVCVVGGWAYLSDKNGRVRALQTRESNLDKEIKTSKELAWRVGEIEKWALGDRKWLDHVSKLSGLFPPPKDVYVTDLDANLDGSINFTIQARSNEAITALTTRLAEAGYRFRPGQVKTGNDKHGYLYGTTLLVQTSPDLLVAGVAPTNAASPQGQPASQEVVVTEGPQPPTASASDTPAPPASPVTSAPTGDSASQPAMPAAAPQPSGGPAREQPQRPSTRPSNRSRRKPPGSQLPGGAPPADAPQVNGSRPNVSRPPAPAQGGDQ